MSIKELSVKLHKISADIDCHLAELILLLKRLDELKGWEKSGARHCAGWANAKLGISTAMRIIGITKIATCSALITQSSLDIGCTPIIANNESLTDIFNRWVVSSKNNTNPRKNISRAAIPYAEDIIP